MTNPLHTETKHMVDSKPIGLDKHLQKLRGVLPFTNVSVWPDGLGMTYKIQNPRFRDRIRQDIDKKIIEHNLPLKTSVDKFPFDSIIIVEGINT